MKKKNLEIECPECGEIIDINEQISHRLQDEFADERKQMEINMRKELQASHLDEITKLKKEIEENNSLLMGKKDDEEKKDLQILEMQHKLDTQEQKVEVERQKAALDAKKEAMKEYQKMAEEIAEQKTAQLQMKNNELLDQMRQQKELHQEALRKAEQGSVQTQGEGGEIYIEDVLCQAFPSDIISEVPKGTKGADVLQTVRFGSGLNAGTIVWEGKRTKAWANKWISKIKEDTARANGHISVIVSDVLPSGITRMTMIEENVWVCRFIELEALSTALRMGLIRTEMVVKSQEGKGSKMELLYEYMTSQDFGNAMRMIDDSYIAEIEIIAKERRSMDRNWTAREKAAEARRRGFSEFFGTVKAIHTELPAIKEIEMSDQKALPAPDEVDKED